MQGNSLHLVCRWFLGLLLLRSVKVESSQIQRLGELADCGSCVLNIIQTTSIHSPLNRFLIQYRVKIFLDIQRWKAFRHCFEPLSSKWSSTLILRTRCLHTTLFTIKRRRLIWRVRQSWLPEHQLESKQRQVWFVAAQYDWRCLWPSNEKNNQKKAWSIIRIYVKSNQALLQPISSLLFTHSSRNPRPRNEKAKLGNRILIRDGQWIR